MSHSKPAAGPMVKKATNISLPQALVSEARSLGISLSQACERGLSAAIAEARADRWLDENRNAIEAWNRHTETHGLPLGRFRQF